MTTRKCILRYSLNKMSVQYHVVQIVDLWPSFAVLIDLVDMDGQVKNLAGRSKEYASEVVTGRETYVLIRVESE